MKRPKQIPTLLGISILMIGTLLGVFLINKAQIFSLKASEQITPQQVKITNVSDTSFAVSWITTSPTKGSVDFGENSQLGQIALDERDRGVNQQEYFTHHVVLKNLKPLTKYFFKINSQGKIFDNSSQPYEVTTGPTLNVPLPESDIAYGMILKPEGSPAAGAIVYLSVANTTPLSSLVKNDGTWMIPLSMARSLNLASYASYDKELQIEEIFIQGGNLGTATAITTTKNDSPVPTLTLGQTYDFRQVVSALSPTPNYFLPELTPTPTSYQKASGFLLEPLISPPSGQKLDILNPQEGEKISTSKPEFIGTAPSGEVLEIIIESEFPLSGQVLVDEQGNWQWTPPTNLPPGEHKVTVTLKDESGLTQRVVRTFTVLAAGEGELPAFTATPSGQLTITPTPEPTRIIGTPTPTPPPPKSGHLTLTIILSIIGLTFLILGFYKFKEFKEI